MSTNYVLSCESTTDLTKKYFEDRDIKVICFHYSLDNVEHIDDFGETISYHDFYQAMADGKMTKTSQISVGEFIEYFTPILESGKDILHLTLSSGISGVYNSACTAAELLKEKYPERKIYIVDSLAASSGFGLLVDKLADIRDGGATLDELHDYAEQHKLELQHWFFSTDLKYYVRGGRISKASGFIGGILNICPVLHVDENGRLIPMEKKFGPKQAEKSLVEKMKLYAANGLDYSDKVYISCSDCYDYANAVAKMVEAAFPKMKGKVEIFSIGTTIGAHTGPGTVALFFWGKKRAAE